MSQLRIHGTNRPQINAYYEQQKKMNQTKSKKGSKDQLEISKEALKLQKNAQPKEQRAAYIEKIKQQVDAGTYEVNFDKTAQKLLDFLTK